MNKSDRDYIISALDDLLVAYDNYVDLEEMYGRDETELKRALDLIRRGARIIQKLPED